MKNGHPITDIEYDSIGYPKNQQKDIKYTLIIPKLNENSIDSIVVCKNKKYGLISLENGTTFIDCILEAIYCKTVKENNYYIAETEDDIMWLKDYIDEINTIKVEM